MQELQNLVENARAVVNQDKLVRPEGELRAQLSSRTSTSRPFKEALIRPGLSVIAEFKRGSPSLGPIREQAAVADVVREYEAGGASAISVLTDEKFFGSIEDLERAREVTDLPILRKAFIVDPYQLYEAALKGADAVLLIVAALADEDLSVLWDEARGLDLDCVVEVHSEAELDRALSIDPEVIGINNRNLNTFRVEPSRTADLMAHVPAGKTVVAMSGYSTPEQMEELDRIGVDAVLIGETLMRSDDPAETLRSLMLDEEKTREHLFTDER